MNNNFILNASNHNKLINSLVAFKNDELSKGNTIEASHIQRIIDRREIRFNIACRKLK